MDTPTHALIPLIIYGALRQESLTSGTMQEKLAVLRTAIIIAVVGAMPDAMDPHETLEQRLHSWSHSLVAWAGFSLLFAAIALARRPWWTFGLSLGLSATYFSHLIGDAIAGGLGWSYPFGDHVIGDYYIIPEWWIPADFIAFAIAYVVYRILPSSRARRRRRAALDEKWAAIHEETGL